MGESKARNVIWALSKPDLNLALVLDIEHFSYVSQVVCLCLCQFE